ncbi:hypothetical protein chiPu_0027214 [Chiloscyllium punctatum]|uniref:Uncharacterized protein n=1 Tax=Chiloscyllium punctatum TaxID=137246 RepID=A0A401TK06_CHIPU|nr:hypothetical protein [Chiloscyllium punctatum]
MNISHARPQSGVECGMLSQLMLQKRRKIKSAMYYRRQLPAGREMIDSDPGSSRQQLRGINIRVGMNMNESENRSDVTGTHPAS